MAIIKHTILLFTSVIFSLTFCVVYKSYYSKLTKIFYLQAPILNVSPERSELSSEARISCAFECTSFLPVSNVSSKHSVLSNASNDRTLSPVINVSIQAQCVNNFLSEYEQQCQLAMTPSTKSSKTNANWIFNWLQSYQINSLPDCSCVPDALCKHTVLFYLRRIYTIYCLG